MAQSMVPNNSDETDRFGRYIGWLNRRPPDDKGDPSSGIREMEKPVSDPETRVPLEDG